MSLASLVRDFQSNKKRPEEFLEAYQKRIQTQNQKYNAFVGQETQNLDVFLKDLKSKQGKKLFGVPIAIKDNIHVKGWELTCSSHILKGYIAPYNATVTERLLSEGAVPLGRTNMDEFAFGSSCETSHYGPTKNPWNLDCVPGGSSGGSAAAVAADLAPCALGSDTGGSIRQPASFCGVVGLKPTYGRVSRYGLVAFASSLDQIGPLTQNVEDAALLLEVIAGSDPNDSTSADVEVPEYTQALGKSIRGLKVGIPKEFFKHELEPDVKKSMDESLKILEKEGADIQEVSLPHTDYAISVYYIIGPCEASSNLARFEGVRYGNRTHDAEKLLQMYTRTREEGFGQESKRRIILGTFALSSGYYDAYYRSAMKVRRLLIEDFNKAFSKVDILVTPTAPTAAFKLGEKMDDPLQMYLSDIFTISANLSGVPGISVPCGLNAQGLPMGIQFMAKPFNEETLFQVAYAFEDKAGFKNHKPKTS